ncbi:MAG: radical SAM protein [Pirellulaceae bacterium]|nr:radical SAM protein [Pirellulaceae bacterium]
MHGINLPALEYHLAHGCNLSCQQCSHYSNLHVAGRMPTVADADAEYSTWSRRLRPTRFAMLGGEPLLNPEIIEHIKLARRHWPNSELMLVTNGFYLGRHPELPQTLINSDVRLEISQHGTHSSYLAAFQQVNQHVGRWRREYPELCIKIRKSHQGWMRQYNIVNGKPMPFNSDPEAAYGICMQRTCTQLVNHQLAKCPALAYWPKLEAKAGLESIPEWQRFRDYQTCPASASDDEVRAFLDSGAIPQCSICPSKRIPFAHPDPLQRSRLL